jgi:hypothetical protein
VEQIIQMIAAVVSIAATGGAFVARVLRKLASNRRKHRPARVIVPQGLIGDRLAANTGWEDARATPGSYAEKVAWRAQAAGLSPADYFAGRL